jgi:hypothetical protein
MRTMFAKPLDIHNASHDVDGPLAVADACRRAALAFVNDCRDDAGDSPVVDWLAGPYVDAVRFTPAESMRAMPSTRPPSIVSTTPQTLREIRFAILAALDEATRPGQPAFVHRAERASFALSYASDGTRMIVPRRLGGDRVLDLVLAFFAVDYLFRPEDYLHDLSACSVCGHLEFNFASRVDGLCERHRDAAGTVRQRVSAFPPPQSHVRERSVRPEMLVRETNPWTPDSAWTPPAAVEIPRMPSYRKTLTFEVDCAPPSSIE